MRAYMIALVVAVTACGGNKQKTIDIAVATVFPGAQFVPGQPTYVVSARTMRDAQSAFRDVTDVLGMVVGAESSEASKDLQKLLGVDPLSAEAVASIGIDLEGSLVMFSEDVNPTFVVKLSSPEAMQAFLDRQRERGLVTQSIVVLGSELFTAKLDADVRLSWVVEKEWLWIHFALGGTDDGQAWFEHSKRPAGSGWVGKWQAAQKLGAQLPSSPARQRSLARSISEQPGLVGFLELRDVMAKVAARASDAMACAKLVEPVNAVNVAIESDGKHISGLLAIDIGGSAPGVVASLMAPPPGWTAAAARAPLAAQWNLDLKAVAGWFTPCATTMNIDLAFADQFGVRTGRAMLHALDPDDKEGTGAIALDLSHSKYFASLLDQVPMRSKFERNRAYGAYKGKHLSVPFVATADYVLDDRVFLAAMGDGLLAKVATGPAPTQPPILAVELLPPGMPVGTWQWMFQQIGAPSPKRLAQRLHGWSDIHLGAVVEASAVVIDVGGNRR